MSIKYDNKTVKLIQNKTIQQYAGGVEIGRIEITTYNIEDILRNAPIADLHTHKNFLHLLYPFFIRHILKPQYKNRNFTFTLSYEAITARYLKPSYIVLNIKWHGDFINIRPLAEHIFNQIEDMEDVDFIEPMQNIRLVILSQQEQLTKQFLNTPIPKEENANENKTFQSEECAVCISNPPNVLFCNCGHLCICSDCFQNIRQLEKTPCVVCKKENKTIRVLP